MKTHRSTFLGSVLATTAAYALAPYSPACAADDVVRIGALAIDLSLEPFYAQQMGFFKKAGLAAEITPFSSGSAAAAALIGGTIDVAITDTITIASAHARGVPISYIAPGGEQTSSEPTYTVIVAKNSPIETAKDFSGKTVAVNGIKNILQIPFEAWVDNNGGDSKSIKFIELPFPSMAPAIEAGQIDAASVVEPFFTIPMSTGKVREIPQTQKGLAPAFALGGWSVTNDWAAKHGDVVKKFVAVMIETARWANANHAESAQILASVSKMSPELANKVTRCRYSERLEAARFQPVIDATAKYGVIGKSFPAREIFSGAALR
ncbi:MAG TPA: ABC transporter substrate-binding protein [Candidatus Acidoferrales bacterium]|nr:ABC transporter substrate-binding protein [Candidatus Acidoferrales bacterium]